MRTYVILTLVPPPLLLRGAPRIYGYKHRSVLEARRDTASGIVQSIYEYNSK